MAGLFAEETPAVVDGRLLLRRGPAAACNQATSCAKRRELGIGRPNSKKQNKKHGLVKLGLTTQKFRQ